MRPRVTRRTLGAAVLTFACGAAFLNLGARHRRNVAVASVRNGSNAVTTNTTSDSLAPALRTRSDAPAIRDSQRLRVGAALLAACVLGDSALEHYRGAFENPGMYAPLVASASTLFVALRARLAHRPRTNVRVGRTYGTAIAVGVAGLAFHAVNIGRREGGFGWLNLFYGAPLIAPAALIAAGATGIAADRVGSATARSLTWFDASIGRVIAACTSIGLLATSAEAALLHFRGAFHNPVMWAPISIPPVAASLLAYATVRRDASAKAFARTWLRLTALLGVAGVVMHGYGVTRAMGGFGNASQNVVDGPPLPAPPSFTALAGIGLAALSIVEREQGHRLESGRTPGA